MPPRATWKGHMKLSLVSFGVRIFNATTTATRISLNQLHKDCNSRLKQKMVCPVHGDIERAEIAKGYEYEEGKYVIIEPDELEALEQATSRTIEIDLFTTAESIDPTYLDAPYYVAPEGAVAESAFRVIREAMRKSGKVGVGRMVLHGAEHVITLEVKDTGFRMFKLRAASEVRPPAQYFEDIQNGEVDRNQLKLAEGLIESMTAPFQLREIRDSYQEALRALIQAKIEGREPAIVQESQVAQTFNFMDALKRSVEQAESAGRKKPKPAAGAKKPPARSIKPAAEKKRKKA